jgi:hypothetical protein
MWRGLNALLPSHRARAALATLAFLVRSGRVMQGVDRAMRVVIEVSRLVTARIPPYNRRDSGLCIDAMSFSEGVAVARLMTRNTREQRVERSLLEASAQVSTT